MTGAAFVDTNLLAYARDATEKQKQPRAREWMDFLWRTRSGRISVQVLQEYYVTVTQRLKPGLPVGDARNEVRDLFSWKPVHLDAAVLEEAWSVQDRYRFSFWDSLIVAAARLAGCRYLLTEDLQDRQDLGGLVVVDPFVRRPADLD
jgi:predicted nucleic acid-binding protein